MPFFNTSPNVGLLNSIGQNQARAAQAQSQVGSNLGKVGDTFLNYAKRQDEAKQQELLNQARDNDFRMREEAALAQAGRHQDNLNISLARDARANDKFLFDQALKNPESPEYQALLKANRDEQAFNDDRALSLFKDKTRFQASMRPKKGPKQLTISEQLALQKYKDGKIGSAEELTSLKALYPNMPDNVTSAKAANTWISKNTKNKSKPSNFESQLFDTITDKDSGDTEAVASWIKANQGTLNKLPNSKKNALLSEVKARYAQESKYDLSDYIPFFGGTPAKDALGSLNLK